MAQKVSDNIILAAALGIGLGLVMASKSHEKEKHLWHRIRMHKKHEKSESVNKFKLPMIKGHDYTNIIRDLGNNQGTLYQVIDNTSKQQDKFIDHSIEGKTAAPAKQLLNFDEWHIWRGETGNQDIGPTARRYDIDVTEPPNYIVNNKDPTKSGTLIDAGTPRVAVKSRDTLETLEPPTFEPTWQRIGFSISVA